MKFFFDNCISPRLARAIHELSKPEHEVLALRDRFDPGTADTVWIPTLGVEGGWTIVSGDLRIRTRPQERELLRAARLTTFFMAKGFMNLPDWEQVRWTKREPRLYQRTDGCIQPNKFLIILVVIWVCVYACLRKRYDQGCG